MKVSEMIRRLRVALEDEEQPYKNSSNRIMQWLQGAYMDRQLQSDFWKFLHQRGKFITTEAGTADYAVPLVKDIKGDSLYYTRSGSTARVPVYIKNYDTWVFEQASGSFLAPSAPSYLIENPDRTWKVEPEPDGVYEIYADRWHRPAEFVNKDAEPLWEEEFHEIVLLDAMKIAVALNPESPTSAIMAQQVRERLPQKERQFNRRYLPCIGATDTHL